MGKAGLSKTQKAAVADFQAITGADAPTAQLFLQAAQWSPEAACNQYLDLGGSSSSRLTQSARGKAIDQRAITKLFDQYAGSNCDIMLAEGVSRFCEDLDVDPADIVMLVISYHFHAETSCEFSRKEFLEGMNRLGSDSIPKLKKKLPELRSQLSNPDTFQDVYTYAYLFSREKGQKCVQLDMAIPMWRLLFSVQPWPLLDAWCSFLEQHHKHAISKDTWLQLLDFIQTVSEDLSDFDDNAVTSAWPYLIDDFVAHLREHPGIQQAALQHAQNGHSELISID